jgi:scyllo-inosose 3-dehydrogenase
MIYFLASSLVEPASVAYNAVIERGSGIRPVGLAAFAVYIKQGAARVILSEPENDRAELGLNMGADQIINPLKTDYTQTVLELNDGMGAVLFLEATGLSAAIYSDIEAAIWEGRTLNSTVVVVTRTDAKMPVSGEVLQVRRVLIIGAQGHSGHGTFPRVIECMGDGMDLLPLITKKLPLKKYPKMLLACEQIVKMAKLPVLCKPMTSLQIYLQIGE